MLQDKLISVESSSEHDLTSGKTESHIYVKMYTNAVKGGLIADLGDSNWRTLCVISSFMDERGNCWPTQSQIAKGLGVSRQAASARIRKLLDYRWQGRPLITAVKGRTDHGQWDNTRYTVMPVSQLRIFNAEPEDLEGRHATEDGAMSDGAGTRCTN